VTLNSPATSEGRWLLYRLVGDPLRLRLLALAAEEELSIGELSELLDESQPNVSRHAAALRQGGLVSERRHGTRSYLRIAPIAKHDVVVLDALEEGRRLCLEEQRLARIVDVVRARDASGRDYFERVEQSSDAIALSAEIPAFVYALSKASVGLPLAVDVGTGDGAMLDILAPSFRRVVAIDRSPAQLERAAKRIERRAYDNVELLRCSMEDALLRDAIGDGADVVFATRVLHHAAVPRVAMATLSALLRPGGQLVLIDYDAYTDDAFRLQRADVWMGFSREEIGRLALGAGLSEMEVTHIPSGYLAGGADAVRACLLLAARRPFGAVTSSRPAP